MAGFFGRLFGSKKKEDIAQGSSADTLVENVLENVVRLSQLDLQYNIDWEKDSERDEESCWVNIYGNDEELLRKRDGQLLDAFQLLLTRIVQHQVSENHINIYVDNDGFREETHKGLIDLAEKLKNVALSKGKPVYLRALPPKERKIVHQFLAEDGLVRSRSIGEGLYKKIKLYPLKDNNSSKDSFEEGASSEIL